MTKPRMFIDGQVFQTSARDRGLGRYSACIVKAIIAANSYDVTILLSKHLSFQAGDEAELKELFNGATFQRLDLWPAERRKIDDCFRHNVAAVTKYIESQKAPDSIFFIPALFQEPTVPVFPAHGVRLKTLLYHDLIPYQYHVRYEPVMKWQNYLKRFRFTFEADLIFANSQTVADDLHVYLGVPKRRICRIDGAAIHTTDENEQPQHIDASKPFILFNTSDDPRKNNLRTVLAFEEFRRASDKDWNLVLTSHFNKRERELLQRFSRHLQFSGSVHERQLNWLFDNCELVLFPPESEGLGLPALEAVDAGKKVVASSINVLREISTDAFYFCDHESSYSIAQALLRATAPEAKIDTAAYKTIQSYYSWPKVADRMQGGILARKLESLQRKPRIAIFMPAPSGLTGVGLTGAFLHPTLSEHFDIDYYLEQGLSGVKVRPNYLPYVAQCYPSSTFSARRYAKYDGVFYHIGNGDYHLDSITAALTMPGFAIVHDTTLVEAYRVMGETGLMSKDRIDLEARLDTLRKDQDSSYYTSIANRQLGVLVHSKYAAKAIQEVLTSAVPVVKTGLPSMVPVINSPHDRERLVIGLAGAIASVKGLDVIKTIAEDPRFADCDIRLFGYGHASPDQLAQFDAFENVSIATDVTDYDFQTSFAKLDIFVNYRFTYKGETSNTTLEAMRYGVAAVVRKVGWYDELPDDVVIKVETPEDVIKALAKLVQHKEQLRAIGAKAKAYVDTHFRAEDYVRAMKQLLDTKNDNPNLRVAKALRSGKITSAKKLIAWGKKESE